MKKIDLMSDFPFYYCVKKKEKAIRSAHNLSSEGWQTHHAQVPTTNCWFDGIFWVLIEK